MRYQQNVPSPNPIFHTTIRQFSGGLNNRSELLQPHEAADMLNMSFNDDNVVEKRHGTTTFDAVTLPGPVVFIGEYRPYNGAPDILMRATATGLYAGTTKVHDLTGQMTGINHQGKFIFADGQKIYTFGIFPQVDALPYVDVVGTPIATNTILQIANPPFGYTPLPKPEVRGKTVYDYTTGQVWYEPCVMELEDVFKGANILPESPRYLESLKGRLYASGSDRDNDTIYIGDVSNPYYFPVTTSLQLPPNSDRIIGLRVYDNAVVCGRVEDMYAVVGDTNNPDLGLRRFTLHRINAHTGWANHEAVNVAHNYLFYLGSDGNMYALSGAQNESESIRTQILSQKINIFAEPISLNKSDLVDACSAFYDDKWYISIGGKVLSYAYRHQAWTQYDSLNIRSFFQYGTELIWGDTSGRTSKKAEDYLDHTVPFKALYRSGSFNMGDSNNFKYYRDFFIVANTFSPYRSDITVTFEIDYEDVANRVSISNQVSLFGESEWGDLFISRNINASSLFRIGRRGRNIRFKFSNGYTVMTPVATYADLADYPGRTPGIVVLVLDENVYYAYNEDNTWSAKDDVDLNQAMRIYEINGEYEFRGKR